MRHVLATRCRRVEHLFLHNVKAPVAASVPATAAAHLPALTNLSVTLTGDGIGDDGLVALSSCSTLAGVEVVQLRAAALAAAASEAPPDAVAGASGPLVRHPRMALCPCHDVSAATLGGPLSRAVAPLKALTLTCVHGKLQYTEPSAVAAPAS